MEKKWYNVSFSAEMSEEDVRAMNKCFYDAMEESMQISPCADLKIEEEKGCNNCGCISSNVPYCTEKTGHCPQCGIIEISEERKDELFNNMITHITELVSGSDLRSTLHCIGFTDEEITLFDIDCGDPNILLPEIEEILNNGLSQIEWLNEDDEITEDNIDDILCDLKPFFEESAWAEPLKENFDEWYDEFSEDNLKEYLLERGTI
jgi:hypothetical protein